MEKYEKDIITICNFLLDFKGVQTDANKEIKTLLLCISPIALFLVCGFFISTGDVKIIFGVLISPIILGAWATIAVTRKNRKNLKTIENAQFCVVNAKVIQRYEEILPSKHHTGRPNILVFEGYGNFNIPEGVNFSSAKQFSMRETEFFRTSQIGDIFYLVVDKNNNILLAYNTKFFELQK